MKIQGLDYVGMTHVDEVRAIDLVTGFQTYAVGDGQWSIEAKTSQDMSAYGPSCMEWVGSNGTRYDEEPDDLWAQVEEWQNDPEGGLKVVKEGYDYRTYEAPDGTRGSISYFKREAMRGHLHGCVVAF